MNEQQAIALVQKTFKSAFDRSGYIHFLKNLLNEFDDEGARSNQGARIPDKFQNYVEKLERVGKYLVDDHEIMLFIVYLKNDTSIERARTMQRNFVAAYLQKDMKDAALVAFVSKDPEDWRFSFIKMEYRYDEEKNKIKEEFTPAKRWSFLVGTNEASHTAQRKLVPLMADDEHNPTLADLEDAFNIEKVTKEFFEKYRGLFIRTKEELDEAVSANPKTRSDFESKGIDSVNLAKKLLGQIIFLYYLQKKGWFGVARDAAWGEGSRNFLRELFDKKHGDYKNFFNDILEPLFYDALRRDRSEDDHYYPKFNCKIPFLNGGLFDPMNNYDWVKTDILLPNELFHNKTKTKEGDEGDGILDIFDRYNFTVKEDEPFEKEVAIDPELLGKAYEKFNAIRPDNYDEFLQALKSGKKGDESKFNKQYGVYYTPREIVHYMCQQSLINYLYSELNPNVVYQNLGDDKLDMFGNAVKSGQLDLTEEHRLMAEVPKEDIETLILKGEQIKEHDERVVAEGRETATYSFQMPESIRAHAALIDEKLASIKVCDPAVGSGAFPVGMMSEIVRARDVLRSWTKTKKTLYDFKRGCIENSLYGVDIDSGAVEIAKLRLWLSLVVDEDDIQHIKPLPNLDYKVVQGNSLIGVEKNLFNNHLFAELEALKPLYFNATNITQKQNTKQKIDGLIDQITDGRAQFDFEIYFSEVFHEKGGFDVVIANPPYITVALGKKQKFFEDKDIAKLKTIYKDVFEYKGNTYVLFLSKSLNLANSHGTLTYIIPNTLLLNSTFENTRKHVLINSNINILLNFKASIFEDAETGGNLIIVLGKAKTKENTVKTLELQSLEYFSESLNYTPVEQTLFINNSEHKFNLDNSNSALINKINNNSWQLDEISEFYNGIKTGDNQRFLSDKKMSAMYQPVIRGRDVHKYSIESQTGFVLFDKDKLWSNTNEKKLRKNPKILVRQTGDNITAALDENSRLTLDTTHLIFDTKIPIKSLLGILNSKLMNWYYIQLVKESGRVFAEVKIVNLKKLPIPKNVDNSAITKELSKLVERILAAKAKNPQADTSPLEEEIDELVYQLYGLTEEEKNIVKGQ